MLDTEDERLVNLLQQNLDKSVKLTVYSSKSDKQREVEIRPTDKWGGSGLLGVSIRFCCFKGVYENVYRVLDVHNNSPAFESSLQPFKDYIVGTPDHLFSEPEDFENLLHANLGKSLTINVYNSDTDSVREVEINPRLNWGGEGMLGCDIGTGLLHRIPLKGNLTGGIGVLENNSTRPNTMTTSAMPTQVASFVPSFSSYPSSTNPSSSNSEVVASSALESHRLKLAELNERLAQKNQKKSAEIEKQTQAQPVHTQQTLLQPLQQPQVQVQTTPAIIQTQISSQTNQVESKEDDGPPPDDLFETKKDVSSLFGESTSNSEFEIVSLTPNPEPTTPGSNQIPIHQIQASFSDLLEVPPTPKGKSEEENEASTRTPANTPVSDHRQITGTSQPETPVSPQTPSEPNPADFKWRLEELKRKMQERISKN